MGRDEGTHFDYCFQCKDRNTTKEVHKPPHAPPCTFQGRPAISQPPPPTHAACWPPPGDTRGLRLASALRRYLKKTSVRFLTVPIGPEPLVVAALESSASPGPNRGRMRTTLCTRSLGDQCEVAGISVCQCACRENSHVRAPWHPALEARTARGGPRPDQSSGDQTTGADTLCKSLACWRNAVIEHDLSVWYQLLQPQRAHRGVLG